MFHLVYFNEELEEDSTKNGDHFGILNTEDKTVQCLCCGAILEDDSYEIIDEWPDMGGIDDYLKRNIVRYDPIAKTWKAVN